MPGPLSILSWNLQSPGAGGGAELDEILRRLEHFGPHDVHAFCEVRARWIDDLTEQVETVNGVRCESDVSTSGGRDRLLVVRRRDTLASSEPAAELSSMAMGGGRAPLVVPLRHRASGREFRFVMNHLHAFADEKRLAQCDRLNAWAREQDQPIVAAGDYNFFDVRVEQDPRADEGYRRLTRDDVFRWVTPKTQVRTHVDPDWPDADWILDFFFVAHGAKAWPASSEVLLSEVSRDYFVQDAEDNPVSADHRPIRARFSL